MPKNQEYIVTKLEKRDKAWPEFLDKSIENTLKNKESSKELIDFYTKVKTAIWHHLNSNLERIIKDIHKEKLQSTSSIKTLKPINVPSSALTVAMPINLDMELFADEARPYSEPTAESKKDPAWLEHANLLSEIIEQVLGSNQSQNLNILADFNAPRLIAVLVAGYLVNAMQTNLTPPGMTKYGELYSRAAIRVIVEKQLGGSGRLADYNALIKSLVKVQANKDKVVHHLLDILVKSAQIGNPYTRAINKHNVLVHKTITASKAFAKYGISGEVFKPHADFLQFANTKNSTLLFSSVSCVFLKKKLVLRQYFQLENAYAFLSAELFFAKAAADYGDAQSQFNYGVDVFTKNKTLERLSLAAKYWLLAAQQGVDAAKHNYELYLYNTNNYTHDKATRTISKSQPPKDKEGPKVAINIKKGAEIPDLRDKAARQKVVSEKTISVYSSSSLTGSCPNGATIVKRAKRSYKKDRDIQLLRHITTQLYGFCRTNKIDAIEVQAMYYGNSLYIATNMINAAKLIANTLKSKQAIKEALTSPYSCGNNSKAMISKRHAYKIRTRVYSDFDYGNERANIIKKLLNNNLLRIKTLDISKLDINNNQFKQEPNTVYVVTNRAQLIRHAEEDLMDILEAVSKIYGQLSEEALIYGKRRPCFSCYSRLDSLQDKNGLHVKFNSKPGLFFESAFYSQSPIAATETFSRLSTVSRIYESADDAGYNTLSDSDNEEDKNRYIRS